MNGPGAFEAGCEGVGALAGAAEAWPRVRNGDIRRVSWPVRAGSVGFAEGMASADQRHRLAVVHTHAAEDIAYVLGGIVWVVSFHWALGIDVNEPNRARAQSTRRRALAVGRAVGQARARIEALLDRCGPKCIAPPTVHLVLAASTEAQDWPTHRFDRHVAGQGEQVAPRKPDSVLLLDGLEERTRLVEIRIVWPTPLRLKALAPARASTAPI
mmetsp:Transcript_10976/g.29009  ORF Transcript_10976/g.29009 Transcript_10976/m.29009 type:complete len:213 (-) Transcript_10976:435-1073(-)